MNKISQSLNLLNLPGAKTFQAKDGSDWVAIPVKDARLKLMTKRDSRQAAYLNFDAVEKKDGPDAYEKTHTLFMATTKEERAGGLKLPIIGDGREYRFDYPARQNEPPKAYARPASQGYQPEILPPTVHEGDDIPF